MQTLMLSPKECGMTKVGEFWYQAKDGDEQCRGLFDDHYSRIKYADGRKPKLFVGPGEKTVLITGDGLAIFVWRKFKCADGNEGINCAVFRNTSGIVSSALIRDAERIAWKRWPGHRLFTFVNPRKIRSSNPGYCFQMAGWRKCGTTKWNKLIVMEKLPEPLTPKTI